MSGPSQTPGRLTSLLANAGNLSTPSSGISRLSVQSLSPSPLQPRRHFDQAALESLASSIKDKGILTPLLVRPLGNGRYEIVAGERRWRAAQLAGLEMVPAVSRPMNDDEVAAVALIENLQREDLSPFEEIDSRLRLVAINWGVNADAARARLYENARTPNPEDVATLETLFSSLGRESWQSFTKNKLRVLNWPQPLVTALREGMVLGTASLIATAPEDRQEELIQMWREGAGRAEIAKAKDAMSRKPVPRLEKRVGKILSDQKWVSKLGPEDSEAVRLWLEQMPRAVRLQLGDEES